MIMKGKKIKIIIVIDLDTVHAIRGEKFLDCFRMIHEIFEGHSIDSSCLLIISKVDGFGFE